MITLFKLRKSAPELPRPFKVPFYPLFPAVALTIASLALVAMTVYNLHLALIYFGILLLSYAWFHFFVKNKVPLGTT
jgi:ethanolamine permease